MREEVYPPLLNFLEDAMKENILGFGLLICVLAMCINFIIDDMKEDYEVYVLVRSWCAPGSCIPTWDYIGWNKSKIEMENEAVRLQKWCAYGEYKVIPIMDSIGSHTY